MSFTSKRNELEQEREQNEDAVKVIARLQTIDATLTQCLAEIDDLITYGQFDLIDPEIVAPAVAAITDAKTLQTSLASTTNREMLDWRP